MPRHRSIEKPVLPDGVAAALRDWKAVALFTGMTAVFFYRILLGEAWLWEDMVYFSYPLRVFAATSIAMGHLPLWNPYIFTGMPFFADIQTSVLYLPCVALTLFVRDGGLNFYWLEVMVIAHYVLAGWAMYLFASSLNLQRAPAVFAGATYMLSGFMITHAIHQQIITLVAWFPLITMLLGMALGGRRWSPVFLCALLLGHSTFAGFPQLSLFFHGFLFAYALFLLVSVYPGRALLSRPALVAASKAAAIIVLGLAVSAIQLLPTAELADLSQRAQIPYEKATEGSLAWPQLLTLIIPKLFGAAGATGSTYWGPGTYWYFWETCIYIGILPVFLAILSALIVRRNPHAVFFWCVAVFTILFALGNHFVLHRLILDYVPGFSRFRNPARAGVFFSMAASVLSAFALQELMRGEMTPAASRRFRAGVFTLAGAGAALWIAVQTGMLDAVLGVPKNPAAAQALAKNAHVALLFVLLSAAALLALRARKSWFARTAVALPVLFFADMFVFGADLNTSATNPMEYFHRVDRLVNFFRTDMKNGLFRVNTRNEYGMIMDRNQGMVDRIFTTEGYTPLALQRAIPPYNDTRRFDLLNVKYRTAIDRKNGTLTLVPHPTFMPRAFFLYDVRLAASEDDLLKILLDSTWDHRTTAILEQGSPIRPVPPGGAQPGTARITAYEDNRIELDASTPTDGLLVLSEVYYPGWKAYVDGSATEVMRTDYNLRGIALRAGSHHVVFEFSPPPVAAGAWISAAGVVVCLTGMAAPLRRRKPLPEKGD